jgi:lipopolysaccharide/colanic/teichoic acid biosynthesis glycosyltransferase
LFVVNISDPIEMEPKTESTAPHRIVYRVCKRAFDLACSFIGLVLLSPLLVGVAIAIRISSPGPVVYQGRRVGLNGKLFHVLKFRTMVVNADRLGGSCTADDDVRITGIGRWLRKTKLDELPQLINVLLGEMSFVGPRPELEEFTNTYAVRERKVLQVKPGITDLATLWNSDEGAVLAGEADPDRAYREKILPTKLRLQLQYVERSSFLLDLRIVMQTAVLVGTRCIASCLYSRVSLH